MSILTIFRKKTSEELPKASKIQVEDLLEQGFTCKEVSDELHIDIESVYRIQQAKKRREATIRRQAERVTKDKPQAPIDPVQQMQQQIMLLKLEEQMDRIQERQDLKIQERQATIQESIGEVRDDPDSMIKNLLVNAALSKNLSKKDLPDTSMSQLPQSQQYVYGNNRDSPPLNPQQEGNSTAAATPIAAAPAADIDPQKIIVAVKAGLISKKMFLDYAVKYGLSSDQAVKSYDFIRQRL